MKKVIYTLSLISLTIATSAQIKVISGGNVGIGQSNPTFAKFEILNPSGGNIFSASMGTTTPTLNIWQTSDVATPGARTCLAYRDGSFEVYDISHTTSRLWINGPDGRMGIRTNNPDSYLTLYGGKTNATGITVKSGDVDLILTQDNATNVGKIQVMSGNYNAIGTTVYKLALNPEGGNVGIGTTVPGYQLELSTNSAGKPSSSTWNVTSDVRTKTNINPYTHGLDLVRQIRLVSYEYNGLAHTPKGEKGVGVIAQDFQKVFPNSVREFTVPNDLSSREGGEKFLGVDFHELFIANVNAVKELDNIVSVQNKLLKATTDSLIDIIKKQESISNTQAEKINNLQNQVLNCCSKNISGTENDFTINNNVSSNSAPVLYQNIPNPFNQQTSIEYFIPTTAKSASIMIFDLSGKLMNSVAVNNFGKATVMVNGNELKAGMFVYSLIVDGKLIDSKKMILTN